jgi:predicted ATP-dependent endonuclease of OLD family
MRIKKLHLENIGVFNRINLEFQPNKRLGKAEIHIFTGENGTGKSTLLYALASAYNNGNNELLRQRFRTPPLNPLVEVFLENNNETVSRCLTHKAGTAQSLKNNGQAFAYSGNRALKSYQLSGIQEITESPFDQALSFVNSTDSAILNKWIVYNKAKEAFALMKHEQVKAKKYRTAIQHIESVVTEIVGFNIEFVLETEQMFNVVLNIEGQRLELDVLPDGLKSIISWIADLFMRLDRMQTDDNSLLERHFILFLDEIDIHLHPAWQRQILLVIQKLFPNAQIFVSTHSPFVVGSVSDAYVYKFKLKKGGSHLDCVEESKAGSSVLLVLDEVFDIDELFDIETETQFEQFYQLRDEILQDKNNEDKIPAFLELARHLTQKGVEVTGVVGRELRQMSRIINRDLSL